MRAYCFAFLEDYVSAQEECQRGLAIDSGDVECKDALAGIHWKLGDHERSVELRGEIVRSHPDNMEARFAYGNTCGAAEHYDLAVDCFRKILQYNTLDDRARASAYYNLGLYLSAHGKQGIPGKDEEALDALLKSECADPTFDGHRRDQVIVEVKERLEEQGKAD